MSPEEIRQAAADGAVVTTEGVDPGQAADHNGHLLISDLVAIPIGARAASLCIDEDVELLNEAGTTIGTVCFGTRSGGALVAEMTRWQFVAYLADAKIEALSATHDFAADYVVIEKDFFAYYITKCMASAPLWGGFTHDTPRQPYVRPRMASITAKQDLILPTAHHRRSINRYVEGVDAFDRFLKLYHTLELLFDFVYMKQIQRLEDDLVGFGRIMSAYGSNELVRLKYIIATFCDDPGRVAQALTLSALHISRCEEIFHDHSKDGDPLKEDKSWMAFKALVVASQLAEADIWGAKLIQRREHYDNFIYSVASYWIYRVRSSIVHSRVGEFIFADSDEIMIAEFAEPLLMEVARQVFSGARLKAIVQNPA